MPARGCGASRTEGGVYWALEPGPDGLPIEHFLFCSPWEPPQDINLSAVGVHWMQDAHGTWHLLDICGSEHYRNVADWIEECLLPSEPVSTDTGLRPIGEVQVGDRVLTHTGVYRDVAYAFRHHYSGNLISIQAMYSNLRLRLTPEHPVYAIRRGGSDREFIPAKDLRIGDMLCVPIASQEHESEHVRMSYRKVYTPYRKNAIRSAELAEKAQVLSSINDGSVRQRQVEFLKRLPYERDFSYSEIERRCGDMYASKPGTASALRRIVAKGLLQKIGRGWYRLTNDGRTASKQTSMSVRELAANLGVGMSIAHRLRQPPVLEHDVEVDVPLQEPLLVLIGFYLAEGSPMNSTQNGRPDYYCATEYSFGKGPVEEGYAQEVAECAKALGFGATISLKDDCYHVVVYSRHLVHFLVENFGKGAKHKFIPEWAVELPAAKKSVILSRYLNGDGNRSTSGYPHWDAVTASLALAHGLMLIGNSLGYRTSIHERQSPGFIRNGILEGRAGGTLYRMVFYEGNAGSHVSVTDGYILLPIRDIATIAYDGDVCNLEVDGDNSYCTTMHAVHNCRRYGVSRRLPKNLDFSRLTRASRLILLHARANILNWPDFLAHDLEMAWDCPRRVKTHRLHKQWERHLPENGMKGEEEMCSGFWWHDVEGGEPYDTTFDSRAVERDMPSFKYRAHEPPRQDRGPNDVVPPYIKRVYTLAGVGAFPATRLVVIRAQDNSHASTAERIKKADCALRVEEEDE